jgi:hypothetical protein
VGTVSSPAVRGVVGPLLSRVGRLPHVSAVVSPYAPGVRAISRDGTIAFGSIVAMGLPVVSALLGLGVGLGLVGLASRVVGMANVASELALLIGLGVGIDYALFIVTRFRDAYRDNGGDVQRATELAMNSAGRAVLFAGTTAVIALLGMFALGVNFLNGLAIAASLGVLSVLAHRSRCCRRCCRSPAPASARLGLGPDGAAVRRTG